MRQILAFSADEMEITFFFNPWIKKLMPLRRYRLNPAEFSGDITQRDKDVPFQILS